ncbi:MAG: hypothetical protein OEY67_09285 [Gammaproteobacteria bacterium]|nr:hypothetical protein [Gammaproteobacteria bacterium]
MRNIAILVGLTIVLTSTAAIAGIKDKKSMGESEKTIATATADAKKACGNPTLESKIDWSSWDKYDYKKLGKNKADILRFTGGLAKSVLESLADLCKDADYKAEVAKITKLSFSGKDDPSEQYVAFALDGSTLNIKLNGDGVGSWKNADLLKAVWE